MCGHQVWEVVVLDFAEVSNWEERWRWRQSPVRLRLSADIFQSGGEIDLDLSQLVVQSIPKISVIRLDTVRAGKWTFVAISQTHWLVSQERLSPRVGTSVFIDLIPCTPSGEWWFLQLVCHTTLLPL